MSDPILDEIRRVRKLLLKEHGGLAGHVAYVQKLDRARRRRGRTSQRKGSGKSMDKPWKQWEVHLAEALIETMSPGGRGK